MIGSLMILSSALFFKWGGGKMVRDAYRRDARSNCALQCFSLEQERENAPFQRVSIKINNVITQQGISFLCERYLLKDHGWNRVTA